MRIKIFLAVPALAALGLSAATPATQTYAARGTTALTTVVPTDFQVTWNTLLERLNDGDFTINASIKEQSTIRVLLQSQIPSTWVDCGTISVNSKHKVFGNRSYKFLAANSVRYMVDWLVANTSLTASQAYCLCGAAADLKISEIVDTPNWIVSCYLPLTVLNS